jgi:predicted phage terminase large subunit-like protein
MKLPNNHDELFKILMSDQQIRKELCSRSHYWFFHVYFGHYVQYKTADFQRRIFEITEDGNVKLSSIISFRGSAKSTIVSLSNPIWSILGILHKKYPIIIGQTQNQSRQILKNIKSELESNELLIKDFGPFNNSSDWRSNTLVIPKFGARITALSAGESIRGLRHHQYRPDLIICDDIEDLSSVKFRENRDKNFNWFMGDVVPLGDVNTKIILIGNLLHEDSLMMRIKDHILVEKDMSGTHDEFPLLDENHKCLWPDKFPTEKEINELKSKIPDRVTFEREYLLHIVADGNQVVQRDWIKYHDTGDIPNPTVRPARMIAVGIDLAISEKTTADFTAIIPTLVYGYGDELKVYVLPFIVNQRLDFIKTKEKVKEVQEQIKIFHPRGIAKFYAESVGYQASLAQQLTVENVLIEPVSVGGADKRSRLCLTSSYIESGKILFPKHGAEELIDQIVNFGVEKHDDLADAFSLVINKIIETDQFCPKSKPREYIEEHPHLVYNKLFGEWIDPSRPITAGMLDMVF